MNPPLPGKYLGNCVDPALALAPKDALAAGGLLSACAAVAAGRHRRGGGRRRDGQHGRVDGPRQGGRRCDEHAVRGRLAEVPRHELDLGFGRPAKVVIVMARTGAVAVAESRRGAAGGVKVGVPLPLDGMGRFRKCFADAIAGLHAQG